MASLLLHVGQSVLFQLGSHKGTALGEYQAAEQQNLSYLSESKHPLEVKSSLFFWLGQFPKLERTLPRFSLILLSLSYWVSILITTKVSFKINET